MSNGGYRSAVIGEEEWRETRNELSMLRGDVSRLSGQIDRLTTAIDRLEKGLDANDGKIRRVETLRRRDEVEDLREERDRALARLKATKALPAKIVKWVGWLVGAILGCIELYRALH